MRRHQGRAGRRHVADEAAVERQTRQNVFAPYRPEKESRHASPDFLGPGQASTNQKRRFIADADLCRSFLRFLVSRGFPSPGLQTIYIGMGTNPVHGAPHLTDWQSLIANNKVEVDPYGNGRQA